MSVLTISDVHSYFHDAIRRAEHESRVALTDSARFYVLELVSDPLKSESIDGFDSEALAIWMSRADEAPEHQASEIYKNIGDKTLYRSGILDAYQSHKCLRAEYFEDIGELAYSRLSELTRKHSSLRSAVFSELSSRFKDMICLLKTMTQLQKSEADADRISALKSTYGGLLVLPSSDFIVN